MSAASPQPGWSHRAPIRFRRAHRQLREHGEVAAQHYFSMNTSNLRENHVVEFEEGRRIAWLTRGAGPTTGSPGSSSPWTRRTRTLESPIHTTGSGLTDEKRFPRARATTADKLRASLDRLAELAQRN